MEEVTSIDLSKISRELEIGSRQVENVVRLLDDGNTVPFITRYRKEWTGNLDEEQIRSIESRIRLARQIDERAKTILRVVEAQGKLTDKLRHEIEQAETLKRLEDLYLPFRPKRQSRATKAKALGLEPLATRIWDDDSNISSLQAAAQDFVADDRGIKSVDDALQGAADILAERISDDAEVRNRARAVARKTGRLSVTAAKPDTDSAEYEDYFDYTESITRIPPHRVLALNRGEKAGALRVKFVWDDQQAQNAAQSIHDFSRHRFQSFLLPCLIDAVQRLIQPAMEREFRRDLTERAEKHAVAVFAQNLKNLLLQPPLTNQRVLAIDPGFRTGCKVAALDECGNVLGTDVVYTTGSPEKRAASTQKLVDMIDRFSCRLIAIGNGTACREIEEMVSTVIADDLADVRYLIVNEAGASIYSTSPVAREEFPDFDATIRGTVSIGRRLQDPLSELVKIEPQHIGVGMYQHDIPTKRLKDSLDRVIESCVNYVGVDLNTASASLLKYVSGLNQLIARRVVAWREKHGKFQNRRQLMKISGVGEATFTQAAGFLKITNGDEPLDSTWIHPESYEPTRQLLNKMSVSPQQLICSTETHDQLESRLRQLQPDALAEELRVGLPTLNDIFEALTRPGRDPRSGFPGPIFKRGILKLDDLEIGMELTGTVLNVVDFGVFVDVGLKDSGLVHISAMSKQFVNSPHDIVAVGDVVTVWVLSIDHARRRISLTMVAPNEREANGNNSSESKPSATAQNMALQSSDRTRTQTATVSATNKPKSRQVVAPEKESSEEPNGTLRGFDELKQLWGKRRS